MESIKAMHFCLANPILISTPPPLPPIQARMRIRLYNGEELDVPNPYRGHGLVRVVAFMDTTPGIAGLMQGGWIKVSSITPYSTFIETMDGDLTINFSYADGTPAVPFRVNQP